MDDGTRIDPEVEIFLRFARAGDAEKCETLLKSKESLVNSIEAGGYSALHFAAAHGHKNLITTLLKYKADKNPFNYDYNTPLMLAAKCKQPDTLTMLLDAGCDPNFSNDKGVTALHHAVIMNHFEIAQILLKRGAKVPDASAKPTHAGTPLHWAATGNDHLDIMFWLIYELGCPIDAVDANGGTALFHAIHNKASDCSQFLLEHGADPTLKSTVDGGTVLHLAAACGTLDDVKMLLDYGCNPTAADKDGDTPIKIAEEQNAKAKVAELSKTPMTAEQRTEEALRMKTQGNKVFANGENNKAARFYTRAISLEPTNHVFFSNRSACFYNTTQFKRAFYDATRCVALNPKWAKGYFRLAAALKALKRNEEAKKACEDGLKIDANNVDLKNVMKDLEGSS